MTATQHTLALFAGIAGVLLVASTIGFILDRRTASAGPNAVIENLNSRIKSWWVMVIAIGIAFAFGKAGVIALFAFEQLVNGLKNGFETPPEDMMPEEGAGVP